MHQNTPLRQTHELATWLSPDSGSRREPGSIRCTAEDSLSRLLLSMAWDDPGCGGGDFVWLDEDDAFKSVHSRVNGSIVKRPPVQIKFRHLAVVCGVYSTHWYSR